MWWIKILGWPQLTILVAVPWLQKAHQLKRDSGMSICSEIHWLRSCSVCIVLEWLRQTMTTFRCIAEPTCSAGYSYSATRIFWCLCTLNYWCGSMLWHQHFSFRVAWSIDERCITTMTLQCVCHCLSSASGYVLCWHFEPLPDNMMA